MRAVIGGAYNGKREFINNYCKKKKFENIYCYEGEIPENVFAQSNDLVIIAQFESVISAKESLTEDEIVDLILEKLERLAKKSEVICICTDVGRGIVPLQKENRKLRDTCGRLYQKIFAKSDHVIRVWYGLFEVLKGEEWE